MSNELRAGRQAFEHWFSDEGKSPRAVERNVHGGYKLISAVSAWQAWEQSWHVQQRFIVALQQTKQDLQAKCDALNAEVASLQQHPKSNTDAIAMLKTWLADETDIESQRLSLEALQQVINSHLKDPED